MNFFKVGGSTADFETIESILIGKNLTKEDLEEINERIWGMVLQEEMQMNKVEFGRNKLI